MNQNSFDPLSSKIMTFNIEANRSLMHDLMAFSFEDYSRSTLMPIKSLHHRGTCKIIRSHVIRSSSAVDFS